MLFIAIRNRQIHTVDKKQSFSMSRQWYLYQQQGFKELILDVSLLEFFKIFNDMIRLCILRTNMYKIAYNTKSVMCSLCPLPYPPSHMNHLRNYQVDFY
jgi:hypothetical protein